MFRPCGILFVFVFFLLLISPYLGMSQRYFIFNVCMYNYIHFEINLYKKNIAVFCGFFSLSLYAT